MLFSVAACAAEAPGPVAQVDDDQLTCDQMTAEIASNTQALETLSAEQDLRLAQNVFVGVATVLTIVSNPGYVKLPGFALEPDDLTGQEEEALQQRNHKLSSMILQRCDEPKPAAVVES